MVASATSTNGAGRASSVTTVSAVDVVSEHPKRTFLRLGLLATDATAIAVVWLPTSMLWGLPAVWLVVGLFVMIPAGWLMIALARLYRGRVSSVRATELTRMGPVSAGLAGLQYVALSSARADLAAAGFVLLSVAYFGTLVAGRAGFDAWLRSKRRSGRFCRRLVIVGTSAEACAIATLIGDHPELGYRIAGFVGPEPRAVETRPEPWLGPGEELDPILESMNVNGVLICADAVDHPTKAAMIRRLNAARVHVHVSGGLWGLGHQRIRPVPIAHEPFLYVEPLELGPLPRAVKRMVDILGAALLVVLTAPVLLIAAILVRLEDRGPVLFRQVRVGRNGQTFTLLKLRTMHVDAEERLAELGADNDRIGPLFKLDRDPRVTRVGSFLRKTSIDELPQLVNVLRGEMSLVGPRPALPCEVEQFDDELQARDAVRPGITGLWQVEARDSPSFDTYRRLDLFYVDNWTIGLDAVILVLTFEHVVARALIGGAADPAVTMADDDPDPIDAPKKLDPPDRRHRPERPRRDDVPRLDSESYAS